MAISRAQAGKEIKSGGAKKKSQKSLDKWTNR